MDSNQIFWHLDIPDLFACSAFLNGIGIKMKKKKLLKLYHVFPSTYTGKSKITVYVTENHWFYKSPNKINQ